MKKKLSTAPSYLTTWYATICELTPMALSRTLTYSLLHCTVNQESRKGKEACHESNSDWGAGARNSRGF